MDVKREVYLDNSATTRICEESLLKYVEVSQNVYGNPSSLHKMGLAAERELDLAREKILRAVGAKNSSVIFTASGTEANNLAIFGRAYAKDRFKRGAKIITTLGEHASVSEPYKKLSGEGYECVSLSSAGGKIDIDELISKLDKSVILVSVMMVNNETGALYDIKEIAKAVRRHAPEALIHVDATQSFGKVKFTKDGILADMITISSHKIEGPKGMGALVVTRDLISRGAIAPLTLGGGQESGMRSGTENVPAAAAFGVAAEIAHRELDANIAKLSDTKAYLLTRLSSEEGLSSVSVTTPLASAPHIINLTVPKIKSETLLHYLSSLGIYVSSGSACSSNSRHLSSALTAFGRNEEEADSSIRISLSKRTERCDIDAFIDGLTLALNRLARMK